MKKILILEGILASGKSFSLNHIEEHPNLHKVIEPVELYRNCRVSETDHNALGLYYEDPLKNSVCFELHIIECLEQLTKQFPLKVVLVERYLTSVNPFTQTMLDCEYISKFSADYILQKMNEALFRISQHFEIDKVIFLDTDVEICLNRWLSRERREEMAFSSDRMKEYLTKLRSNYLKFYEKHYPSQLIVVKNNDLCQVTKIVSDSLGQEDPAPLQKYE